LLVTARETEALMYEVDFLPVGEEGQSGDAIGIRFTRPDTGEYAVVIIDAGFQENGEKLVDHVERWYETTNVDIAIVTHPDGDHIGGMGEVVRNLNVGTLCIHRLRNHGGGSLRAADAVDQLIALAESRGTSIHEPFSGTYAFSGALRILGPDEDWYDELVSDQVEEERTGRRALRAARSQSAIRAALVRLADRVLSYLPPEVPFDDAGGTNPRNNSSAITMLNVDGHRMLFTGDAGVPALDRAWNWLETNGHDASSPNFAQIPHAGSRHNASTELLNRLYGPPGQPTATRPAYVSVASKSKRHPSPRVANAYMRRGFRVYETRGSTIHHFSSDAPDRGWSTATPLEPLDESGEE